MTNGCDRQADKRIDGSKKAEKDARYGAGAPSGGGTVNCVAEDTHYLAWPPEGVQVCAAHHAAHATTSSAASAPWPRIGGRAEGIGTPNSDVVIILHS